jgi:hypothetical protein
MKTASKQTRVRLIACDRSCSGVSGLHHFVAMRPTVFKEWCPAVDPDRRSGIGSIPNYEAMHNMWGRVNHAQAAASANSRLGPGAATAGNGEVANDRVWPLT